MGCPDWPKCFGLLAPPTCSCELPANYKELFLKQRVAKLNRFANVLENLGMKEKALALRNNKKLLEPEEFNAFKAWTEYINRVFGVLAGLFSLVFTLLAFRRIKTKPAVTLLAFLGLLMLLFNAWLGSIVVATNLLPGIVTIHFLLSFLCIFFFAAALHFDKKFTLNNDNKKLAVHWNVLFIMIMIEVILGTLAREQVEVLTAENLLTADGMLNIGGMGLLFAVHRFLPLLLVIYLLWLHRRYKQEYVAQARGFLIVALLSSLQVVLGACNIIWVLPSVAQVLHIVLGALLPVVIFYFVLAKPHLGLVVNSGGTGDGQH